MSLARAHSGQASVEFTIASVFLLVPLMLMVFLIGKYIDIKATVVEAARYAVFERTVFGPACDVSIPVACDGKIRNIAVATLGGSGPGLGGPGLALERGTLSRFFSAGITSSVISSLQNTLLVGSLGFVSKPFWKDQAGNELLPTAGSALGDGDVQVYAASDTLGGFRPIDAPDHALEAVILPANIVAKIPASVLGTFGVTSPIPSGFQLQFGGRFYSEVSATVKPPVGPAPFDTAVFTFSDGASLLTDSWSAPGEDYMTEQVNGVLPTALFNPITDAQETLTAGLADLSPPVPGFGLLPDLTGLQLGKITTNLPQEVPPDRLGVLP